MRARLLRWWWVAPIALLVSFVALRPSALDQASVTDDRVPTETPFVLEDVGLQELASPRIAGATLPLLVDEVRPPAPMRWAQPGVPVPFAQWWSGLATGPGIPALWAKPLLLRMGDDGRADLSAPVRVERADGLRDAEVTPALFFEFGSDVEISVVDSGPLHVRFAVVTSSAEAMFTMVQGSPFVEIEGSGTLGLTVPALDGFDSGSTGPAVQRFSTAAGTWLVASSGPTESVVVGDRVDLELATAVRHVIGPVPSDADDRYDDAALRLAESPLLDSAEELAVAEDGSVRQTLSVSRLGEAVAANVWALLPHHIDFATSVPAQIGSMESIHGRAPVVVSPALTLDYPAVPVVWGAAPPVLENDDPFDAASFLRDEERPLNVGSYFGAKDAATDALLHDVLDASGRGDEASEFLRSAARAVGELLDPETAPALAWEPLWGSVVVTPPEFGAAEELNDHHLQNGYWVAAAASVVVADPAQRSQLETGVDLLIADYAGADLVPATSGVVSDEGVWSAFAGHGWASGIGGFGAGNSLESISESSHAWWAAAKWFLATDRPELADPFIARLTIESWLTGYEWLPTAPNQSDDQAVRPWTGVVWSGKADPGTWFSASDEAALGIRLIPVGPQSFSRYPNRASVAAAEDRWRWCDRIGGGCADEWWNLLDTDAVVAGRPPLAESEFAEPSTAEMVRQWWRTHWETTDLAPEWSCSPGTTIRGFADGSFVALVTNPGSVDAIATCERRGSVPLELTAEARSARSVVIDRFGAITG